MNRIGFSMQEKTLSVNTLRVDPRVRGEDGLGRQLSSIGLCATKAVLQTASLLHAISN